MEIVPVIDIRGGGVVRAIGGRRAEYQAIKTPLAKTSAPRAVVAGLRAHYEFRALYVADLDAIEGRGDNDAAIATIAAAFPDLRIWLDSGARAGADLARLPICENLDPVIGSETFTDLDALGTHVDDQRIILSLDFRQQNFLGAEALLSSPNLWPRRVIVMTLDRVGTRGGPDIARLTQIRAKSPGRMFYAAGGVRGAGDLAALAKAGAAGALVSTALHEGALF